MMHRTRRFRALDFDFRIETDHPGLTTYLDTAFAALAAPGDATHVLTLTTATRPGDPPSVKLDQNSMQVPANPARLVPSVMSLINRAVADSTGDRLLLHASAVETQGKTIVFAAPMNAGKTTLAAGLVQTGYRYVTDEAVAIDPDTLEVEPYPRPMSIDSGSWPALVELRPELPPGVEPYCAEQWHVSALSVRPDAVAEISLPSLIVFPRYEPQKQTRARSVKPARALCELVACAFNVERLGHRGFTALARIVQMCRCYQLTVSDLSEAVEVINRRFAHEADADTDRDASPVTLEPSGGGESPSDPPSSRTLDARSCPARRRGIGWVELDRVVAYEPGAARAVALNHTGSLLWRSLDGQIALGELSAELAKAFTKPRADIEHDVLRMVRQLARLGLLDGTST